MNVKLKAGLEIAGFVVSALAIGALVRLTSEYLTSIYSERQVVEGISIVIAVSFMALLLKTMYDIRVAQLSYIKKLEETVKK
jgi:hypothetical protein